MASKAKSPMGGLHSVQDDGGKKKRKSRRQTKSTKSESEMVCGMRIFEKRRRKNGHGTMDRRRLSLLRLLLFARRSAAAPAFAHGRTWPSLRRFAQKIRKSDRAPPVRFLVQKGQLHPVVVLFLLLIRSAGPVTPGPSDLKEQSPTLRVAATDPGDSATTQRHNARPLVCLLRRSALGFDDAGIVCTHSAITPHSGLEIGFSFQRRAEV